MIKKTSTNIWTNVGVYPTPNQIVEQFSEFTVNAFTRKIRGDEILDLFAGDGRLGISIKNRLSPSKIKNLTFLEIRKNAIPIGILNSRIKLIVDNGFTYQAPNKYDLVVSNPPYLALTAKLSTDLGLDWNHAKKYGRNLFSVGINKCLEVCKPGGIVSVIAPFGYLRGFNSSNFRNELEKSCVEIIIQASSDRNLFEDANQDVAFQLFKKRKKGDAKKTKWKFAYKGSKYKSIHVSLPFTERNAEKYVRVGPIVWNRKKEFLGKVSDDSVPLIYGGNISHTGIIDFNSIKYKSKQFIQRKAIIPTDLLSGPFLAIRRTLRGKPGSWIIDSALILDKDFICTAENHTIIAELPDLPTNKLESIQKVWIQDILDYYQHSGSPNLSAKVVGRLFIKTISSFL